MLPQEENWNVSQLMESTQHFISSNRPIAEVITASDERVATFIKPGFTTRYHLSNPDHR